ncbi:hypothetical protein E2C01_102546 [Portunus trituberculatus]|uniref:Uncharacterized protein n=1 Tax=Portunus trituberculatus TaxID=210409 RepID=A0A5B7KCW8_PORTR|nr:hypothetical protein [Portunus trituberculatus]
MTRNNINEKEAAMRKATVVSVEVLWVSVDGSVNQPPFFFPESLRPTLTEVRVASWLRDDESETCT